MAGLELESRPLDRLLLYVTLLVGLGSFVDGYDLLNVSVALPLISKEMHLGAAMQGLLGTATYLGGVAGALLFGLVSDLRGRRAALIVDLAFFVAASLASAAVASPLQLLALRAAIGLGIGADIVSGPALLSELVPAGARGRLLGLSLLMMPAGGLVSAAVAYLLFSAGLAPSAIWRSLFALGALPAAAVVVLRGRLPESPRWLMVKEGSLPARGYRSLVGPYGRALLYSSIVWLVAGTTSIFTIFSPMILEGLAARGYVQMVELSILLWAAATAGAGVASAAHDSIGRRKLAALSVAALGASDVALALSLGLGARALELALASAMFFSFVVISSAYVVQTEVFPTDAKGLADGISFTVNRLANFAFGLAAPMALALGALGQLLLALGLSALVLAAAAAALGVETARRPLEEVQLELERGRR